MSDHFSFPGPQSRTPQAPTAEARITPTSAARTIRELLPYYLAYAEHEWRLAPRTVQGYGDAICRVLQIVGEIAPGELDQLMAVRLKSDLAKRGIGPNYLRNIVNSLRSFLKFCRLVLGLNVLDPHELHLPKIPRRDVEFLSPQEIEQFLNAIPVFKRNHRFDLAGIRYRSLVEVLLATGVRISEALSLKRCDVDFETGEARIIGKGNKERTMFFTERALGWVKEYVNRRKDSSEWLFVHMNGRRMAYDAVRCWFKRCRAKAGLTKRVTAHMLRHTCATTLLFNGCPIGHIKEILGHDRLETTCRYYLGVDKKAAKEAHRKYLNF